MTRRILTALALTAALAVPMTSAAAATGSHDNRGSPFTHHTHSAPALQEGGGVLPGTTVFFYNIKTDKGDLHPGRLFP